MDNLKQIEELNVELNRVCSQLYDAANSISKLESVSCESNSRISWNGGIIGAIIDVKKGNRINKILKNVIYQGKTFGEFPWYLMKLVENCVSIQQQIQSIIVDKENEIYYGNVEKIKQASDACKLAWCRYSDVSFLYVKFNKDNTWEILSNVDAADGMFFLVVKQSIEDEIRKIDKPIEMNSIPQDNGSQSTGSTGCLWFILTLIITTTLLGFVVL